MPPAALDRSNTVTLMPSFLRCAAATTPLMPAPMTTTRFEGKVMIIRLLRSLMDFVGALRIGQVCYSSISRNYRAVETVHNISSLQVVNCVSTELQLQSLSALITSLVCLAYLQSAWVEPDGTMSSHYCVNS
jgi:hypothetical protein